MNDWLHKARDSWNWRGDKRPPFAEETGPGQESVWDYPRPPATVADTRRIQVSVGNERIAETNNAVRILETASPPTFYIPPEDVEISLLEPTKADSFCEWKGTAQYWNTATALNAPNPGMVSWSYPKPFAEFAHIAGWFSFYPALLKCTVDGELVNPQPGEFYGGWVTNEIVGPFKGDPTASGW